MYYIITSRGICKAIGTNYKEAMENYARFVAAWKKLIWREPSRVDVVRTDFGAPDPEIRTGRNGLRFMVMAG